jgi:broad specificity phosphatase PhoE
MAQADGLLTNHDSCRGLSEVGTQQVARLCDRLRRTGELGDVDVVFTSLLARARQTAEAIKESLGGAPAISAECDFCELHPGDAEGMTWAAMIEKWPADVDKDDPYRRRLPGMETWSEMSQRIGTRLSQLAADRPGRTSVVVTSGGAVGSSFHAIGGFPLSQVIGLTRATTNTSLTEWSLQSGRWQLERFNDAAHLRG